MEIYIKAFMYSQNGLILRSLCIFSVETGFEDANSWFNRIYGLAPDYIYYDIIMHVDINGFDTRTAKNMGLYSPLCSTEI